MPGCYKGAMTQAAASNAFPAPEHDHDRCLDRGHGARARGVQEQGVEAHPAAPVGLPGDRRLAPGDRRLRGARQACSAGASGWRRSRSTGRSMRWLRPALVHRFESRNAFFACHAGHEMRQLILACETCGRVAEVDGDKVFAAIDTAAGSASFSAKGAVVEVWGLCATALAGGRAAGARAWKAVTRREIGRRAMPTGRSRRRCARAWRSRSHHHHHHRMRAADRRSLTMPTR